jgi:hypothetical protein
MERKPLLPVLHWQEAPLSPNMNTININSINIRCQTLLHQHIIILDLEPLLLGQL